MNFYKSLTIKNRLIIASAVTLAGMFYYLYINLNSEFANQHNSKEVLDTVEMVENIYDLLGEIKEESALADFYKFGQESDVLARLESQFNATDQVTKQWNSIEMTKLPAMKTIDHYIDSLQIIRGMIRSGKLPEKTSIFYSRFNNILRNECLHLGKNVAKGKIKVLYDSYSQLLQASYYLGTIRRQFGDLILNKNMSSTALNKISATRGAYDFNLWVFYLESSADILQFFNSRFGISDLTDTNNKLDSLSLYQSGIGRMPDINTWWDISSSAIHTINDTEAFILNNIHNKAESEISSAQSTVYWEVSFGGFIIFVIFLINIGSIRRIVNSLNLIRDTAEKVADGDVNIRLNETRNDEIGIVASAFDRMIAISREYAGIAEAIGQGNYDVEIRQRSDKDMLSIALSNMRNNLLHFSEDNRERTWLLTGIRELNDRMRGDLDVNTLAGQVIGHLVQCLNAQVGIIYIRDDEEFYLAGHYAFEKRKVNLNRIRPGQGLVGQAILEKSPIIFNNVPEDFVLISSGLGNTTPKNIIVFPFIHNDEVNGVAEIGSIGEISEMNMELIKNAAENIAIAIHSARARDIQRELLEETQRQADELATQQEELRQSNEELMKKTEMLEHSEAELKTQQEELQQTNEELEEKTNLLEEQKNRLENARTDIESKARELEITGKYKSEFLSNMSHELRTPLNSILILAQLLAENKHHRLGEKEVEYAGNIYKSGNDLLTIINDVLDLSKVEAGKMELNFTETSLEQVRDEMSRTFKEQATGKNIDFQVRINDAVSNKVIITDEKRLFQILRNLLANAFKFTDKNGSVSLIIEKAPENTRFRNLSILEHGEIISFAVIDSGIGIPANKKKIVFEAFQQVDGSGKRKYGGTGLGLSISRELASLLDGEIHLESEEGKGSTFTLYLPDGSDRQDITGAAAHSTKTLKMSYASSGKPVPHQANEVGKKNEVFDDRNKLRKNDRIILIIEDDQEFAKMMLELVRERKFKGIVATQGNTGLSYARHYKPDAIMLDVKLPVMDGMEVLMHLKSDPSLRHIPVQIISGYDKKKEGLYLGAFDFMQKPVSKTDIDNLMNRIEEFLDRKLKRLLIIEDDKIQNKAIRDLIGNGDVKSSSAFNGKDALKMLEEEKYDCIIMDLGLPDMNGFEILDKIRKNKSINNIPIIVYTGRDLTRDETDRLNKLANTVVLKTAASKERLLDEAMLFLHRVENRLPEDKQQIIRKLHHTDEVLINKTVLVVDDDIRNTYSLTNALVAEGVHCLTAENGIDAISMLEKNPSIDLVLMDVMMPEMDGIEATRKLRGMPQFRKLPIIALTAKAMKGDHEKCLAAGMSDYISKPVNMEQLLSLMRVWLYNNFH